MYGLFVACLSTTVFCSALTAAIVYRWQKRKVNASCQVAFRQGFNKGWDEKSEDTKKIREIEKEIRAANFVHIGGTVITLPNEWSDPVVGKIVGFLPNSEDIPIVADDVSGQECVCFGVMLPYHPEMLAAILKLNPFERYSLAIARTAASTSCYIFDKKKVYEGSEIHVPARDSSEVGEILRSKGYVF